ncbi:hypothetical protein BDV25DRAFT_141741 [Aspergillus avenaceus]|uniref:Cupredoxin n=1 Tax=Aspergillus avenaceus TaxID=36643 RepID=A0A5N6TQD9_ASPAV|nr:hypothetical protein BDV25DRAFT_141741 [Aspergillus avenaceus]
MLACALIIGVLASAVLSINIEIDQNLAIGLSGIGGQAVHRVSVGHQNASVFSPNQLNANIGDQIIFEFHSLNHTLTQSSFGDPCSPLGGLDSGFTQYNPEDKDDLTLTITVNTLEPQWFFCKQIHPSSHCHAGIMFALNPGDRMKDFMENAKRSNPENSESAQYSMSTAEPSVHDSNLPMGHASTSATAQPTRSVSGSTPTASPAGSSTSDSLLTLVGVSPLSSSTPGLAGVSVVTPVKVVTVTQTVGCSESSSALSVRRSTPATVSVSEGSGPSAVSIMVLVFTFTVATMLSLWLVADV